MGPLEDSGRVSWTLHARGLASGRLCARTTTIASKYRPTVLSISTTSAAMQSQAPQASPLAAGRDAPMSRLPTAQPRSIRKSIAKSDCRSATASLSAIRCRTANSGISGPRVGVLASIAEAATLAPTATATALKIAEVPLLALPLARGGAAAAVEPRRTGLLGGAVVSLRSSRAIRLLFM